MGKQAIGELIRTGTGNLQRIAFLPVHVDGGRRRCRFLNVNATASSTTVYVDWKKRYTLQITGTVRE